MYQDKTLVCKECGKEFVFTAGEQEFYASKGFVNEPQRCKACRDARITYFSAFLNCPMVSFAAMIPPGHASVHLRRRGKFQF